jgi:glycosyltransferase involved in cell wall biosynthesis
MVKTKLNQSGIKFDLVYGQPHESELIRKDEGEIDWGYKVKNLYINIGKKFLVWQPTPSQVSNPDLIILTQENKIISNYFILLGRLWSRSKVAYWGHGVNFQSVEPTGLLEAWKRLLVNKVDWWFAYTHITLDILTKNGFPTNKITCLNNAIDSSGFKSDLASWSDVDLGNARQKLNITANSPVGLYCGSLYADKKLELLIQAADMVREKLPNFTLLVIGDGPSMPFMQSAAKSRTWVHLLGTQKGKQKALYFRLSQVMLNPGLVGLHIVDAFCAGLVMCTTKTARHSPEVAYLKNGINGISVDESPESYSKAVIDLFSNPDKLKKMQQAAFLDGEIYTLDNMVNNFVDGVKKALID